MKKKTYQGNNGAKNIWKIVFWIVMQNVLSKTRLPENCFMLS